jgi:hypothetical protein
MVPLGFFVWLLATLARVLQRVVCPEPRCVLPVMATVPGEHEAPVEELGLEA